MSEQQLLPLKNPTPADLFSPGGLSDLLARIEAQARAIVPDTSTAKGRKEIASVAAKVARSKTYIDGLGKDFVAGLKAQAAVVDAERKAARDRLDKLKDEVRKPLTEWEQAEASRVAAIEAGIGKLESYATNLSGYGAEKLRELIADVDATDLSESIWQESHARAKAVHAQAASALAVALASREQYEAEQAELARLRAEAAERERREATERAASEQAEREARIAREAEARAKDEADHARIVAERAAKAEIDRANQERIDAERRAAQAEERARMAAEQERARADAEAAAKKAEEDRRAADVEHRRKVNSAAVSALIDILGLDQSIARDVITAIARGDVPSVHIHY
jgi:septal ring factor EnvC (AmiA/AmiB activator)